MHRLSEKLLAILVMLLLGFSPLQGVMAGIATSLDRQAGVHQMDGMHGDMVMAADQADHKCAQCNTDECCAGHDCASGHCAYCVLALPTIYAYQTNSPVAHVLIRADDGFVNQTSAALFRPPRA